MRKEIKKKPLVTAAFLRYLPGDRLAFEVFYRIPGFTHLSAEITDAPVAVLRQILHPLLGMAGAILSKQKDDAIGVFPYQPIVGNAAVPPMPYLVFLGKDQNQTNVRKRPF